MGKYDRVVDIQLTPETRNNWRLVTEELKERAEAMARMIPYAAAKEIFDSILAELPGGNDYQEIRKSLKLVEVTGTKKGSEGAYAIYVNPKAQRVRRIDVAKTLITIQVKRGRTPAPDDVVFLQDHGPWTADTLPFWPKKSEAIVIQKKVTKKQVDEVAKKQKKAMTGTIHQLLELGRRVEPFKPNSPGRIKRNAKAVPDLAMQALSLEFGDQGSKSNPMWRKSIGRLKRSMGGLPDRFVEIKDAMTDPNSKKYKSWPPKIDKISSATALTFRGFQKRLGY